MITVIMFLVLSRLIVPFLSFSSPVFIDHIERSCIDWVVSEKPMLFFLFLCRVPSISVVLSFKDLPSFSCQPLDVPPAPSWPSIDLLYFFPQMFLMNSLASAHPLLQRGIFLFLPIFLNSFSASSHFLLS
jgi:hypothetical protein